MVLFILMETGVRIPSPPTDQCIEVYTLGNKGKNTKTYIMELERLLNHTKEENDCWIWCSATRMKFGYGAIKVKGKTLSAHRYSYTLHHGDIPAGMFVCHKCDNPKCINPDHLFLGTNSDNMKDAYSKGRITLPTNGGFKLGNKPVNRKLTEEQVIQIKEILKTRGKTTLREIAEQFGVNQYVIRDINCGRSY